MLVVKEVALCALEQVVMLVVLIVKFDIIL